MQLQLTVPFNIETTGLAILVEKRVT